MYKFITSIILLFVGNIIFAQNLVKSTFLKTLDKSYFSVNFGLSVESNVDLYRINYTTVDIEGLPDTASGLVVLPQKKDLAYNIVVYHHGTVGSRYEVPSYGSFEEALPSIFAAYGFIAYAPDYIGLGDSRGFHPYIHAESEAWATKDMVLATESFIRDQGMIFRKELLFSGYSQGGHSGMAAQRVFEENDLGYTVPAAALMSGPYDISGSMKDLLLDTVRSYPLVAYMPFVALSFNEVYGLFDGDINNVFLPQYSEEILKFYNEDIDLWTLNDILLNKLTAEFGKSNPAKMLQPSVLAAVQSDPDHPINIALRENDVYDWKPNADTRLLYCGKDEQVAFQNSLTAMARMKDNGANKIQAIEVDPNGTHSSCVTPAMFNSIFHFLFFKNVTLSNNIISEEQVQIYPNPVGDQLVIKLDGMTDNANISIFDLNNKKIHIPSTKYGDTFTVDVPGLHTGIYIVELRDGNTTIRKKIFKL